MTLAEAIEAMDSINDDTESAHGQADQILLDYLESNNAEELVNAWKRCDDRHKGFWYA